MKFFNLVAVSLMVVSFIIAQDLTQEGGGQNELESVRLQKSVVTTSGFEENIQSTPSSISIIESKELQERPIRDLGEAVSQVPGVSVDAGISTVGGYAISMRGMPASYTLLLLDGKRQGASSETFPNFNFSESAFMPPISAIERIEVIRGPASVVYGSDAVGGVVNVILKKHFEKWSGNVLINSTLQESKHFGHLYGIAAFGAGPLDKSKKLSLQLRAKSNFQSNPRDFSFPLPQGVSQNLQGSIVGSRANEQQEIGGRFGYEPNKTHYIYADYSFARQWYNFTWGNTNFPAHSITRHNSIIRHQGNYGENGAIRTDTSLQYNNTNYPTRSRSANDVILEHRTIIPFWQMNVNVGAQYMYSNVLSLNGTEFGGDVGNKLERHTFALYAEDQWQIIDSLSLSIGVRGNMSNTYNSNISPRVYLVYMPLQNSAIGDLSIKGGISTGYKMPSMTNVAKGWSASTGQGWTHIYGNPNLKPESSLNYELGIIQSNDFAQFSLTGFYIDFKDRISALSVQVGESLPAGYTCLGGWTGNNQSGTASCQYYYNVDTARSYGLEAFAQIKNNFEVSEVLFNLSYTWSKNENTSGTNKGMPLSGIPQHTINSAINYTYKDFGVTLRGEFRAMQLRTNIGSTKTALDTFRHNNPSVSEYYKPYFLLHLGANYNITKTLRAQFGIYNLLNHNFIDYYAYTNANNATAFANNYNVIREGRRYFLSLSMDF